MTLLEKRIAEFNLPPVPYQPAYDRFILYTLPERKAERDTYAEDGIIVKPENIKSKEMKESPRGVVMAAGLKAMDILRGHGISLGSIIWVARFSPWRHVVDRRSTGDVEMMFLRASDVVGCEDLLGHMADGKCKIVLGNDGLHRYEMDESIVPRFDPTDFDDQ